MSQGAGRGQIHWTAYFKPTHFLALVERERQWFEVLMAVGLSLGASPRYQIRMMLVERCWWLSD